MSEMLTQCEYVCMCTYISRTAGDITFILGHKVDDFLRSEYAQFVDLGSKVKVTRVAKIRSKKNGNIV